MSKQNLKDELNSLEERVDKVETTLGGIVARSNTVATIFLVICTTVILVIMASFLGLNVMGFFLWVFDIVLRLISVSVEVD